MFFGFVCFLWKPWESCSNGYFSTLNVGSLVVFNLFNISINILADIMILQTQYTGRKCDEGKNIFKTGIIRKRLNWVHSPYKNSKYYCKMARRLLFSLNKHRSGFSFDYRNYTWNYFYKITYVGDKDCFQTSIK